MAKSGLRELQHQLRDISFWDRIKARLFQYSSGCDHCEMYDLWMSRFLSEPVEITDISRFDMTLKNAKGEIASFWVGNYPYSYGYRVRVGSHHPHFAIKPCWKMILKLRKIQLTQKKKVIDDYKVEMLKG